jgi:predicted nuclease of predicted toxin-antitoxin system
MRLCADENISEDCVIKLRQGGHDVLWIRESAPGVPDEEVLLLARKENRLLITFDKDFGQLVFRRGTLASHGIILFRLAQSSSAVIAERIHAALGLRDDWEGHFSVIDEFGIRMRILPKIPLA